MTSTKRATVSRMETRLSQRDEEILKAIYIYRYLTAEQTTLLFFSPTSRNYAGEYLRRLTKEKYITRFPLPAAKPGNPQLIYTLSIKGIRFLSSLGLEMYGVTRPPQEPSFQHISHSLAITDFIIAAVNMTKQHPDISLASFRPDWMLKHTPLTFQDIQVVPDAALDFRLPVEGKRVQYPLLVELDRGSEDQSQLRRKVRNLIQVVLSPSYAALFGISRVTIAFAVTTGEKRVQTVKQWIEKELIETQLTQEADLFLIGDISPCRTNPRKLFLDLFWMCPFQQDRFSLLPQ
jgi:hypothetical protein